MIGIDYKQSKIFLLATYYDYAFSYKKLEQYEMALELFQKAADMDSTHSEVRQRIEEMKTMLKPE